MPRNLTKWALTFAGVALALGGAVAMWRGWDSIQLERGWSLFIAGAVLLAGGFLMVAAGAIVGRLDRLIALAPAQAAQAPAPIEAPPPGASHDAPVAAASAPAAPPPPPELAPQEAPKGLPERETAPAPAEDVAAAAAQLVSELAPRFASRPRFKGAAPPPAAEEPRPVDTYRSGDLTYVMYSDGSVEVHSPMGAQRYASLEELRAHTLEQS